MNPHKPVYLTTAELARRWSIQAQTLRKWRTCGKGPPFFKPNGSHGRARYLLDDVLAWEKKHTAGGPRE